MRPFDRHFDCGRGIRADGQQFSAVSIDPPGPEKMERTSRLGANDALELAVGSVEALRHLSGFGVVWRHGYMSRDPVLGEFSGLGKERIGDDCKKLKGLLDCRLEICN